MQRFPAMFDKPLKLPRRMRNKLNSSLKSSVTSWRREPNLFECAPIPIIPPLWDSVRPFLQAEQQDKVENSKNDRNWKKFYRKCSRHITFSLRCHTVFTECELNDSIPASRFFFEWQMALRNNSTIKFKIPRSLDSSTISRLHVKELKESIKRNNWWSNSSMVNKRDE